MGRVFDKIEQIKMVEKLSTSEILEKYPYLAELLFEELEEQNKKDKNQDLKEKTLLKG